MTAPKARYRGRFAPSPTGMLHFGSFVAAVASYLDARRQGGEWLVRVEDVDGPRSRPGAAEEILRTLAALGLVSDEEVVYQSRRGQHYEAAIAKLGDRVYACGCSRKEIGESGAGVYPGTCRAGIAPGKPERALRLRVAGEQIGFADRLQGWWWSRLDEELGDFPLKRLDTGIYSYQLAVVVDDEEQGITDVVRGADLLDSTPRQIWLQQCLGYRALRYLHIPVATGPDGQKLSKQNLAPEISREDGARLWAEGLRFLGQSVVPGLERRPIDALREWAIANWEVGRIPARRVQPAAVVGN
ncbi:MAG: tRNA glutamyl-Q(34) synthetase GluQRS [Bryobacter sp.]|nr:tRNA glutamyl-Q(34) synthetase GluQRS [Bryobacter sp. CoA8 C33]